MSKRGLRGSLFTTALALGLVLSAGVGSASAAAIMYVNHLRFTQNGSYTSVLGTHSGGSVQIVAQQGSQQILALQGSGVLAQTTGGPGVYTTLNILAAANTQIQCKWIYNGASVGQPYGYCERFV